MRRRSPAVGDAGFTLVEMIVALAILGLVLVLLGSSAKLLRGTGDRIAERGAALGDLALLDGLLQERLGDAVALDFGPPGRRVSSFDGGPDRARFLTLAPGFVPGEPLVAMAIGAAALGGLELWRVEVAADAVDFDALEASDRAESRGLAQQVTALRLSYFGRKDGATDAVWHATWQAEPRLPDAVRLELEHERLDLAPIIVPIRQSLGALCATPEAGPACNGG